jgi:hypothetical protein
MELYVVSYIIDIITIIIIIRNGTNICNNGENRLRNAKNVDRTGRLKLDQK